MTSLALAWRRFFRTDLYPSEDLPLFITKASLELMDSTDFFCVFLLSDIKSSLNRGQIFLARIYAEIYIYLTLMLKIFGRYKQYRSASFKNAVNSGKGNIVMELCSEHNLKRCILEASDVTSAQIKYDSNVLYYSINDIVEDFIVISQPDNDYPIQKKHGDLIHLRNFPHLRGRDLSILKAFMIRSILATSMIKVMEENKYTWTHLPVLTTNDCEGGGECFHVSSPSPSSKILSTNCFLTVSTQLHAEAAVVPFKKIFSFSPIFRAENSQTTRHLNEFWMLEAEEANLSSINELMNSVETFLRQSARLAMTELNRNPLMEDIVEKLSQLNAAHYFRFEIEELSLFYACFLKKGILFQKTTLSKEDEKWVCGVLKSPVFVKGFPLSHKPFYMMSDGNKTESFDLLLPDVGEVVGGGLRESNYLQIIMNLKQKQVSLEKMSWYADLRRYGYSYSGGYGLGFERLLLYVLGVDNIKDVIFAPRAPGLVLL